MFDFQAFKTLENKFVLKEVAVVGVDSNTVMHYMLKPPYPYQVLDPMTKRRIDYFTHNIHGICWNNGFVELRDARKAIATALKDAVVIYIKGSERANFLCGFLRDMQISGATVVDLDNDADFKMAQAHQGSYMFEHHGYCSYRHKRFALLFGQGDKISQYFT